MINMLRSTVKVHQLLMHNSLTNVPLSYFLKCLPLAASWLCPGDVCGLLALQLTIINPMNSVRAEAIIKYFPERLGVIMTE